MVTETFSQPDWPITFLFTMSYHWTPFDEVWLFCKALVSSLYQSVTELYMYYVKSLNCIDPGCLLPICILACRYVILERINKSPHWTTEIYWAYCYHFRRDRKITKKTINFDMPVGPHGTISLPLDGVSLNLIYEYFSKVFLENSCYI